MKYQALAVVGILAVMALVSWAGEPSLDGNPEPMRIAARNEARLFSAEQQMRRRLPEGATEYEYIDDNWCEFTFKGRRFLFCLHGSVVQLK